MKTTITLFILNSIIFAGQFECKKFGEESYRPYYLFSDKKEGPALGQGLMSSLDECKRAIAVANNEYGVVCSRTGLNGWKPTLYTGTVPGRPDYGYLGGSSIVKFEDCLKATKYSSKKGVCYWGAPGWYISRIDRESSLGGGYNTIDECVAQTKEEEKK